jgi:RNA polymerase sigma factor
MRAKPQETDCSSSMGFGESALALRAKTDEHAREELISRQEKNILRLASLAKHGFATKSDDEWAIALCAFSHAIDTYSPERGAFVPYAETLIKRSLIDEHRAGARRAQETPVSPDAFDGELEPGERNPVLTVVIEQSVRAADTTLRDEILAANTLLRQYGFGFYELTDCSPGRGKTREACLSASETVLGNPVALDQLMRTRQLPMKWLTQQQAIPKKLLERYRKYIIATIIICAGEFPALQGYIRRGRNPS